MICPRSLSLEWNSIGLSDRGMEALSNAIITNKSLESIDLRNNRIGSNASVYVYDIVRQSSLRSLDLRWNELGPQGAKGLVTALQANRNIIQLDLAGNKIGEDMLGLIEDILSKNRGTGEIHSARAEKEILKAMFSPSKTVPTFAPPEDDKMEKVETLELEGSNRFRAMDIKTRYDNELIERERTERKLNDIEQQLGQERENNSKMREDLLKAVEAEKAVLLRQIMLRGIESETDAGGGTAPEGGRSQAGDEIHQADPGGRGQAHQCFVGEGHARGIPFL